MGGWSSILVRRQCMWFTGDDGVSWCLCLECRCAILRGCCRMKRSIWLAATGAAAGLITVALHHAPRYTSACPHHPPWRAVLRRITVTDERQGNEWERRVRRPGGCAPTFRRARSTGGGDGRMVRSGSNVRNSLWRCRAWHDARLKCRYASDPAAPCRRHSGD